MQFQLILPIYNFCSKVKTQKSQTHNSTISYSKHNVTYRLSYSTYSICLSSHVDDFNTHNKVLRAELLKQGYIVQEPKEQRRGSLSFNSRVWQPCGSKYIHVYSCYYMYIFWPGDFSRKAQETQNLPSAHLSNFYLWLF